VPLNKRGEPRSGEWMPVDLKQRIRGALQESDGLLYVLTDDAYGGLLRIEPADETTTSAPGNEARRLALLLNGVTRDAIAANGAQPDLLSDLQRHGAR
jgi:hypothetical protein